MHVGLGPFPCSRHVMKIALQWEIRVVRRPGAKKALFLNSNSDVGILAVSIHTPGNRESILFCYFGHRFTKKNCFTIKNRFRIDFQMIQVPTFLGFDPALVGTPELKKEFKRIHTHTRAFANKTTNGQPRLPVEQSKKKLVLITRTAKLQITPVAKPLSPKQTSNF